MTGSACFVGRDQQLDELTEKLLQPSTRSVVVHGFGGIGKSTLIEKLGEKPHIDLANKSLDRVQKLRLKQKPERS